MISYKNPWLQSCKNNEISILETYDVLSKETIKCVKWFKDSLSDSDKLYFLTILTNVKIYLYRLEFIHNDFYFMQAKELGEDEELVPFECTYLWWLKIDHPAIYPKVIDLGKDKLVIHGEENQIWHVSIQRKLDAYFKNIEYQLSKNVIYDQKSDDGTIIDIYTDGKTARECKIILDNQSDFIRVKFT